MGGKTFWTSLSTVISGTTRVALYMIIAVIATDIGNGLNLLWFKDNWVRNSLLSITNLTDDLLKEAILNTEAMIVLSYYVISLVQLLDSSVFRGAKDMDKASKAITHRGALMAILFWTIHITLGGNIYEADRVSIAKDVVIACNVAMCAFGMQGAWGIYRNTLVDPATASVGAILVTPVVTNLPSFDIYIPDTQLSIAAPAA